MTTQELEETLERERAYFREMLTAVEWARMKDRFHAFDAIKDDACPCCGGRVVIEETHNAVRLRRVAR